MARRTSARCPAWPTSAACTPPAAVGVPADLTAPSREYRTRVVIVFVPGIVFVGVYLALTAGSAFACYWCFAELSEPPPPPPPPGYAPPQTRTTVVRGPDGRPVSQTYTLPAQPVAQPRPPKSDKPVFFLVLGGITAGLICLFMVKGLFKWRRREDGVRVEVTEAEQPVLFAFIRRLCQETGAPFPHRVYLVPDVNAAVSFHESFLNLIFPSRKNLIIGLALVNRLNLGEFKAVLAHEFGHFSQNSMRLGSYVYTANRVIADVVYGRDWLDDLLGTLRGTDIRIAVFAWGFIGILWTLPQGLDLMFRVDQLRERLALSADGVQRGPRRGQSDRQRRADLRAGAARLRRRGAGPGVDRPHCCRRPRALHLRPVLPPHEGGRVPEGPPRNDPKLGEVEPLPDDPDRQTVQVFKPRTPACRGCGRRIPRTTTERSTRSGGT